MVVFWRRRRPAEYRVSWGNGAGAVFAVSGRENPEIRWRRFGPPAASASLATTDDLLLEQALGELETSLGQRPSMQHAEPRPSWMTFVWDPPLPRRGK